MFKLHADLLLRLLLRYIAFHQNFWKSHLVLLITRCTKIYRLHSRRPSLLDSTPWTVFFYLLPKVVPLSSTIAYTFDWQYSNSPATAFMLTQFTIKISYASLLRKSLLIPRKSIYFCTFYNIFFFFLRLHRTTKMNFITLYHSYMVYSLWH